jgi:hypothetical protein
MKARREYYMREARFVGPATQRSMEMIAEENSPVRVNPATEKSLAQIAEIGFQVGQAWAAEDLSSESYMEVWTHWLLDKTEEDPAEIDPRTITALMGAANRGLYEGTHY